jgi:hypothetical protein
MHAKSLKITARAPRRNRNIGAKKKEVFMELEMKKLEINLSIESHKRLANFVDSCEVYYTYFASKRLYVEPTRKLIYINTPIVGVDIEEISRDELLIVPGNKKLYLLKADRGEKIKWAPYSAHFYQSRKWDEALILYLPSKKVQVITSKREFTIS